MFAHLLQALFPEDSTEEKKNVGKAKEFSGKRKEAKQYLKEEIEPVGEVIEDDDGHRLGRIFSSGDDSE